MVDERVLMGFPLSFGRICEVHPPTLNDVLGNKMYSMYVNLLTQSQEDIWDSLAESEGEIPPNSPTPFQQLLLTAESSDQLREKVEEAIEFFTKEPVRVRDGALIFVEGIESVKSVSQLRIITEDNFFDFQNMIREVIGRDPMKPPVTDDHPKVAMIKARARKRERLIQKKGNQSAISLSEMLVALSCMDVGFTLLKKHGEMAYPAVFELFKMSRSRERHQIDMQLIAGGADAKKINPKDWIRNN